MQRCKDMLLRLPQDVKENLCYHYNNIFTVHIAIESGDVDYFFSMQTAYLSLMCYNFGIDTYNLGKFEESVFWLR